MGRRRQPCGACPFLAVVRYRQGVSHGKGANVGQSTIYAVDNELDRLGPIRAVVWEHLASPETFRRKTLREPPASLCVASLGLENTGSEILSRGVCYLVTSAIRYPSSTSYYGGP